MSTGKGNHPQTVKIWSSVCNQSHSIRNQPDSLRNQSDSIMTQPDPPRDNQDSFKNQPDSLRRRLTDGGADTPSNAGKQEDTAGNSRYQSPPEKVGVIHPHGPPMTRRETFRAQTFASTKTVAQGFLNISLLSANAGQLKIVLQQGTKECMFYELLLTLIGLSFILQLLVSYLLASKYGMEMDGYEDEEEYKEAMKHSRWATFIVTLISAVNVMIATFIGY